MFAKTLKQIGENGTSDIFYHGSLGEKIVKEIQSLKGIITMEDLKSYKYYIHSGFELWFREKKSAWHMTFTQYTIFSESEFIKIKIF